MSLIAVVMLELCGSTVGLKVDSTHSDVAEWPTPRFEQQVMEALERTARRQWAEHHVVFGEDLRGDVSIRGTLSPFGSGVRLTWQLSTQECPPMADKVAFEFRSTALTPASLDSMSLQLARRAAKLFEKARSLRAASCIDPTDLPPTDEDLERRRAREAEALMRAAQPAPVAPTEAPLPSPLRPRPVPVRSETNRIRTQSVEGSIPVGN